MSNLSKAIQQSSFQNEYQRALIGVLYLSNQINNAANSFFKQYGITQQQYNVLRILRGQQGKPATINLIKERMLDKMSDASRLVGRLEKVGLVKRRSCTADKRSVDVLITNSGLELLLKTDEQEGILSHFKNNFSEAEAVVFNELLDRLIVV